MSESNSATANQAKRGKFLAIFLVLSALSGIWLILWGIININSYLRLSEDLRALIQNFTLIGSISIVAGILGIACIVALWNWKRWGYFGFYGVQVLSMVASYMAAGFSAALVGPIVWLSIFYFLFKNKVQYLS